MRLDITDNFLTYFFRTYNTYENTTIFQANSFKKNLQCGIMTKEKLIPEIMFIKKMNSDIKTQN